MAKKISRILSKNNGFSLLEAIITIAIVGIVFVPIAMIFNGTSMSSVETREILLANELSQQYIENLKSMNYETFSNFFGGSLTRSISSSDGSIEGLPVLPNGFTAIIDYNTSEFDADYGITPSSNEDIDFTIQLNSAFGGFKVIDASNNEVANDNSLSNRIIYVIYDYSGQLIKIRKNAEGGDLVASFPVINESSFSVECNDYTTAPGEFGIVDTDIYVVNKTTNPVDAYLFRNENDQIKPNISTIEGIVNIKSNLYKLSELGGTHRIYRIIVRIMKDGDELIKLNATKINE